VDPDRCIENVTAALAPHLESGRVPGYVAGVSIGGQRRVHAAGTMAAGAGTPIRPDALFRIASLSKVVAAVVALALVRDGVVALDDDIARWLPELGAMRVIGRIDGPIDEGDPAPRPIVVSDLLTMTAGFGLVLTRGPLRSAIIDEGLMPGPFAPPFSHDEFVIRLARLPLAFAPGAGWLYHTSSDVLGVLLARASGEPLHELVSTLVAAPLGLADLSFRAEEPERLATAYSVGENGLEMLDPPTGRFSRRPRFESFGAGLISTVPDFLTFLEMLGAGGAPILNSGAVTLMGTDCLSDRQRASAQQFLGSGRSWGLGCEVVLAREQTALPPGSFGWMGGTGTTAYVDPEHGLAAVLFTQRAMESNRPPATFVDFWDAVYQET
jgi:CubicO group peptidase (beta-lactamase class C family)